MVGRGTVVADDPDLTCRLSGLENRSPHRFILAKDAASVFPYRLCREVSAVPTTVITSSAADTSLSNQPQVPTTRLMMADCHGGNLALPEILEDMAALGYSSLMVEGGARVAQSFLEQNLVSTVALFSSDSVVGDAGLASPFTLNNISPNFKMSRQLSLGQDRLTIFDWKDAACLPE